MVYLFWFLIRLKDFFIKPYQCLYTTSISTIDAYNPTQWSSTSNHSSYRIVERLLKSNKEYDDIKFNDHDKLRMYY